MVTTAPVPKPRTQCSSKKAPVPLPRRNTLRNVEVRLRQNAIQRAYPKPIVLERQLLNAILEGRPKSIPSCSPIPASNQHSKMSARAIAARSRCDGRPLSAYDESPESKLNRRRASVAVMPLIELEQRDRAVESMAMLSNNRTLSPEFGAIRVQVEDITAGPSEMEDERVEQNRGESFDSEEFGETSSETICELNHTGIELSRLRSDGIGGDGSSKMTSADGKSGTRVNDLAIRCEYASSSIAQELSATTIEERPRPPIPAIYMNTTSSCSHRSENDTGEGNYSDFVLRRNSSNSSPMGKTVTLLEQIIRTRKIWFLPHLGRPEVLHMLRKMDAGNFIVRASTRENCMALSVRLPANAQIETDHYIIEQILLPLPPPSTASINVVRLEGSPLTFRSLPLLIEHYCVNGEELEVRLQLPAAIQACTTTKQLQSIALMEQEFWTSEMSLSRKPTRLSVASSVRTTHTLPRCNEPTVSGNVEETSTWFMENEKSTGEEIGDESAGKPSPSGYYAVHDTLAAVSDNNNKTRLLTIDRMDDSKTSSKKRRSTSRASSSSSRFATVCGGDIGFQKNRPMDDETDSGLSSHSPPSKHDRIDDEKISRSERRSQSVRSHKNLNIAAGAPPSSSSSSSSSPRSFLRSLLSFGTAKEQQEKRKSKAEEIGEPNKLASCDYFTPWDRSKPTLVKVSRSAFDIANPPARGFFAGSGKKRNGSDSHGGHTFRSNVDIFDDDNYTKGWKEIAKKEMTTANASPGGKSTRSESMKTFKPSSVSSSSSTHDEVVSSRSRPLAMRRERSDLCATSFAPIKSNVQRLAYHNESSPGPATHATSGRKPMTPPINANDPQIVKSCVDELRRKRLQSTNEMLMNREEAGGTPKTDKEIHSAHASPQIAMRRKNGFPSPSSTNFSRSGFAGIDRTRGAEHRLSVPNLVMAADPMVPGSVGHSAKALRERMARNNDGELMVINEGLITPVVRRKNFELDKKQETKVAEVEGVSVAAGEVAKRREALESLIEKRKQRQQSDAMSSGSSDQSSLGRKYV
ncbi:unnamed protein product [Caenorhabditis bovis]|uniref:SH2 domain-containing protein n=1 Tax=Caenorhabditis bovis TaxID=2654633 RepID=A0A8S1EC26_9PELO|nr:unnamed protein product [Caenorhabditis bovis]